MSRMMKSPNTSLPQAFPTQRGGAAREAAREFRRAEKLLTDDFPIEHAASFAAVLDLSGAPFEASTIRARTVARAQGISSEAHSARGRSSRAPRGGTIQRRHRSSRAFVADQGRTARRRANGSIMPPTSRDNSRCSAEGLSAAHWAERAHNLSKQSRPTGRSRLRRLAHQTTDRSSSGAIASLCSGEERRSLRSMEGDNRRDQGHRSIRTRRAIDR